MRGKNAAAASRKRLAEQEAAALAERQETDRALGALRAEVQELKAENQQLRGTLTRRAKELSSRAIQELREQQAAALAVKDRECSERLREAFRLISSDPAFRVDIARLPEVATALGIRPVDIVPGAATSREVRRNLATPKRVRMVNEHHKQVGS